MLGVLALHTALGAPDPMAGGTPAPPPVVGGTPVPPGRWPDAVALFSDSGFTCTGTLIAPDLVLTAGHCMVNLTHARVGSTDPTAGGEAREVLDTLGHPEHLTRYDVGLVWLDAPVQTAPRALLADCLGDFLVDGALATVAGYGRIDRGAEQRADHLMQAQVPVVDAVCADPDRGCRPAIAPGGELLAGGEGVDSCTGDSGGPLYLDTPDGQSWLAGVVSRGAFPASTVCGDGGIYVRADAVRDWIESAAGLTLARPSCEGLNRPPRLHGGRLELTQGRSAALPVEATDPDGDGLRFEVVQGPSQGWVDAELVFHAAPFQVGPDRVVLRVVDDGTPAAQAQVAIPIAVYPAGHLDDPVASLPRGCGTAPGGVGGPAALALLALRFRRRRAP